VNIIIPIAGRGSRFKEAGYKEPKPLILVKGKPMVTWATDSLPFSEPEKLIFICLREHEDQFSISDKLYEIYSRKIKILFVEGITEGAASTVLLARDLINNDEDLIISNADQYFVCSNLEKEIKKAKDNKNYLIPVFEATHPRWSFVKTDEKGMVLETAEKVPISNKATVGVYYFSRGADFVWAAEEMIRKDIRRNNEFYVCPVFNQLIDRGDKVKALEVESMWSLGSPEDVAYFEKYFR